MAKISNCCSPSRARTPCRCSMAGRNNFPTCRCPASARSPPNPGCACATRTASTAEVMATLISKSPEETLAIGEAVGTRGAARLGHRPERRSRRGKNATRERHRARPWLARRASIRRRSRCSTNTAADACRCFISILYRLNHRDEVIERWTGRVLDQSRRSGGGGMDRAMAAGSGDSGVQGPRFKVQASELRRALVQIETLERNGTAHHL